MTRPLVCECVVSMPNAHASIVYTQPLA